MFPKAVTGMPSGAVLRSTIHPTESGTVTRTSATAGPARSMSRRAFSTASRADNRSISPISRWLPARTHSPPSPARTATRTAATSAIAECAASNTAPGSVISASPFRSTPRAGARRSDHGARSTRQSRVRTHRTGRTYLQPVLHQPTDTLSVHSRPGHLQTPDLRTSKYLDRLASPPARGPVHTPTIVGDDMSSTPNPFRYKRSHRTAPGKGHYPASNEHLVRPESSIVSRGGARKRMFSSSYGTCLRLLVFYAALCRSSAGR